MRNSEIVIRCTFLGAVAVSLSACDLTTGNPFASPSGAAINTVKCSQSSDPCLKAAAVTCGGPYQVMVNESHSGGILADQIAGPVTWYTITYKCGPSDGEIPTFTGNSRP